MLDTEEDFELHIVDSDSKDNTWEFLQTLKDPRIKEIKKMTKNYGFTYNANYILAQRKPGQYFIHFDSDTQIISKDWFSRHMEVMNNFPKVGMTAVDGKELLPNWPDKIIQCEQNGVVFEKCARITGWCCCIRPEVLDIIGYFNEETYQNDTDMSLRINYYTDYETGFVPGIQFSLGQSLACHNCPMKDLCTIKREEQACISLHHNKYANIKFAMMHSDKYAMYQQELKSGKRTIYCASVHDAESLKKYYYNKEWAEENFKFYSDHSD